MTRPIILGDINAMLPTVSNLIMSHIFKCKHGSLSVRSFEANVHPHNEARKDVDNDIDNGPSDDTATIEHAYEVHVRDYDMDFKQKARTGNHLR